MLAGPNQGVKKFSSLLSFSGKIVPLYYFGEMSVEPFATVHLILPLRCGEQKRQNLTHMKRQPPIKTFDEPIACAAGFAAHSTRARLRCAFATSIRDLPGRLLNGPGLTPLSLPHHFL